LIRNVPQNLVKGYYEWDGTDGKGNFVASGVYLYLLYNDKLGTSKVGKVAVVRGISDMLTSLFIKILP